MSSMPDQLTFSIDGKQVVYEKILSGHTQEPDPRRLILSIIRYNDATTPDYVCRLRRDALANVLQVRFPNLKSEEDISRHWAMFHEWARVVPNINEKDVEWAKHAKECGLIDSFLVDYGGAE